jgi:hypothetical protein
MLHDTPIFIVPCPSCPERGRVYAYDTRWPGAPAEEVAWMLGCSIAEVLAARRPCSDCVAAAHRFDVALATDFCPPGMPADCWDAVLRSIVWAQTGPTGLPVDGGVLHVLFARGGYQTAATYWYLCTGRLLPGHQGPRVGGCGRARMRMQELAVTARDRGKVVLGEGLRHVMDAIDAYLGGQPSEATRNVNEDGTPGQIRRSSNIGTRTGRGRARRQVDLEFLYAVLTPSGGVASDPHHLFAAKA